jgi:hypothetical protein
MSKHLLALNLQLFADEFGGYDPSSAYEGIEGVAPEQTEVQPQGQGEGQAQAQPQAQPEMLDFGGRKLQANDDLLGLHRDYTEQQRYITALQGQVNALQQLAQQPQPTEAQAQPENISANVQDWSEETWQTFYDKPQEVLGQIVNQAVQQFANEKLEPIVREREWNNELQRMYQQYPDFDSYVNDVQALINQEPNRYANRQGGLEEAYYRAKATSAVANPAQLAQDPNFVQQYVLNNPQLQNQVVQNYLQQKQTVNQQVPVTMGRGAGGVTPQTPEDAPTTLREASRQFMKNLGIR